jgi:hypothetical protein
MSLRWCSLIASVLSTPVGFWLAQINEGFAALKSAQPVCRLIDFAAG